MNIQGLVVPAITPRIGAGVDLASLAKLLDFLIAGGVATIFILGTTGEFRRLSPDEKRQVIKHSAERIQNRVPMLVGISAQTIEETLDLADASQECGAQALVLAPMFGEMKPAKQIGTVIENSSLPIMLYNNPAIHRKISLPLSIVEEFSSHAKVIGIKDSSGDWDYFLKLMALKSPEFGVLQGKESMIVQSLEAGSDGIVAGVANIIPALCKKLWLKRDQETMDRVAAVKSGIKQGFPDSISGYKQRLVELGIIRSAALFSD